MEIVLIIATLWFIWWLFSKIYVFKKEQERYVDDRGYERNGFGRLVHRDVAYKHLYNRFVYSERFGEYDVHHIDGNKRNNSPENLEILSREEHKQRHGG